MPAALPVMESAVAASHISVQQKVYRYLQTLHAENIRG
jgi:hypothetical protein